MSRQPILSVLMIAFVLLATAVSARQWTDEYEKKIGNEAAAELEKGWKMVKDEAQIKKLNAMAALLGAQTQRPNVTYDVRIINDKQINAFSIPGGIIYVTTGLLQDVHSEHELAGVIAHEITHNTFYDSLERGERNKKLFMGSIAAALTTLLVGGKSDQVSAVLAAGEYIRVGVLSHYTLEIETRADEYAVQILLKTKEYNPVGMLTFMERLAARERQTPRQELGIFADHPDTDVRVRRIVRLLEQAGVDLNRRAVTKWEPPVAEELKGEEAGQVALKLWGVELLRSPKAQDSKPVLERYTKLAEGLREKLAADLASYEITVDTAQAHPRLLLQDQPWLEITPEEAAAAGLSQLELARKIQANLRAALHKENLGRWY